MNYNDFIFYQAKFKKEVDLKRKALLPYKNEIDTFIQEYEKTTKRKLNITYHKDRPSSSLILGDTDLIILNEIALINKDELRFTLYHEMGHTILIQKEKELPISFKGFFNMTFVSNIIMMINISLGWLICSSLLHSKLNIPIIFFQYSLIPLIIVNTYYLIKIVLYIESFISISKNHEMEYFCDNYAFDKEELNIKNLHFYLNLHESCYFTHPSHAKRISNLTGNKLKLNISDEYICKLFNERFIQPIKNKFHYYYSKSVSN